MLLYVIAIFCATNTMGFSVLDDSYLVVYNDIDELSWSESYTVKATRISVLSNIVEDFTVWKTNTSSRMDCNNGAVKIITKEIDDLPILNINVPVKFEIHPYTTEEVLNKLKCHIAFGSLDDVLPDLLHTYKAVGNESIEDDKIATRFESVKEDRKSSYKRTIWAYYSDEYGWVPAKFEYKTFNSVLGALIKHEIWSFYDYYPDVLDENVFELDGYDCDFPFAEKHTLDSEKVTKELLFINVDNEKHVDHVFNHFKTKFNRQYAHEIEHDYRRAIFAENMRLISSVNNRNLTYKLGVNEFTDQTPEERRVTLGLIPRPKDINAPVAFPYDEDSLKNELDKLPKEYDMRDLGLITAVKNQEHCGSCWTFAAVAVMEGALARVNGGKVLSLSNQAIVDCAYEGLIDHNGGGCDGGLDTSAYNFIQKHGLPTDEEYGPYKMRDDYCHIANMTKTYTIQGYTDVTKYGVNAMKVALFKHGPLFISVHVSEEFFAYSSGIFYQSLEACNPELPNHAVAMVGYGVEDGEPFWILKNSYGEHWGEAGYMRISARDNVCGVATNPSYPVF